VTHPLVPFGAGSESKATAFPTAIENEHLSIDDAFWQIQALAKHVQRTMSAGSSTWRWVGLVGQ